MLGYLDGNLIWCGWFQRTRRNTAHLLKIEGITDSMTFTVENGVMQTMGIMILCAELLMIQSATLIVVVALSSLALIKNRVVGCLCGFTAISDYVRARSLQVIARTRAIETIFMIWSIYLSAILINDPRGIRYDSIAAVIITLGFVLCAIYLIPKLLKIHGRALTFLHAA